MKLYYYKKSKKHKSADTDVLILTSVGAFCEENSLSPYNGVVKRTYLNKPFLENDYLYVGVTHTNDVIIVAVSRENFGIDCENTERIMKKPDKIMCRFFTENERQYATDTLKFLEIWTRKESLFKFLKNDSTPFIHLDSTTPEKYGASFSTVQINDYIITICKSGQTQIEIIQK